MPRSLDARIARLEAVAACRPVSREEAMRQLRDLGAIPDENGIYRCPPPDPNARPCDPAVRARVLSELRRLGCLHDDPDAPQ